MAVTTLTYGQKIPANGDRGSIWFPALSDNFTRLDSHDHDGSNSKLLTAAAITTVTDTIHATAWGSVSNKLGLFSQAVTMPVGYLYASKMLSFRDTGGDSLFLQTESTSNGTFRVYCNNSALDVVVYYGI